MAVPWCLELKLGFEICTTVCQPVLLWLVIAVHPLTETKVAQVSPFGPTDSGNCSPTPLSRG